MFLDDLPDWTLLSELFSKTHTLAIVYSKGETVKVELTQIHHTINEDPFSGDIKMQINLSFKPKENNK